MFFWIKNVENCKVLLFLAKFRNFIQNSRVCYKNKLRTYNYKEKKIRQVDERKLFKCVLQMMNDISIYSVKISPQRSSR